MVSLDVPTSTSDYCQPRKDDSQYEIDFKWSENGWQQEEEEEEEQQQQQQQH